jgi:hypothetical protein
MDLIDDIIRSLRRLAGPSRPGASVHATIPKTCDIDVKVSETISNCPSYPAYNNKTFGWDSKYQLKIDKANCKIAVTVKVKVTGTVTQAQKDAWKSAIESKWNGKATFSCTGCDCPRALPVSIVLQYVDSGEHYDVAAQAPGATADGRAGLGGTNSMTGWGTGDTVDITHEFGHMLGNPEEYFTTNGVDYTNGGKKQGFRDSDGGIMNNPANDPTLNNFEPIRKQVEKCMGGVTCTTSQPDQVGDFPQNPSPDTATA